MNKQKRDRILAVSRALESVPADTLRGAIAGVIVESYGDNAITMAEDFAAKLKAANDAFYDCGGCTEVGQVPRNAVMWQCSKCKTINHVSGHP